MADCISDLRKLGPKKKTHDSSRDSLEISDSESESHDGKKEVMKPVTEVATAPAQKDNSSDSDSHTSESGSNDEKDMLMAARRFSKRKADHDEDVKSKGAKIRHLEDASQNENEMQFITQLFSRKDITPESDAKIVLEKLKREGLVNLPTETSLSLVMLDISRRKRFHQCNLQTELAKKLATLVPFIYPSYPKKLYRILYKAHVIDGSISRLMFHESFKLCARALEDVDMWMREYYHPVIRKERIEEIFYAIEAHARRERPIWIKDWLQDCPLSYSKCLGRMRTKYVSSKTYKDAQNVVRLHQQFHKHLVSCKFIKHDNKIKNLLRDKRVVPSIFEELDKTLLVASLKERLKLLKEFHELEKYKEWMRHLVGQKIVELKSSIDEVVQDIRVEYPTFPEFPTSWVFNPWETPIDCTEDKRQGEMKAFYKLLDKIKKYTDCPLSYAYLLDAILDYRIASREIEKEIPTEDKDPLFYLDVPSHRSGWLNKMACDTYCDHPAYKIIYGDVLALI